MSGAGPPRRDADRRVSGSRTAGRKGSPPPGRLTKRTLIRRATFDLIGLPPTPEEIEAFLADTSPKAFETVVDRLLASPQHGEKWGRWWLDVARYADTAGETADMPVPDAWRYRNYVINAVNADRPFDQFLREQIAGDLLARDLPDDAPPGKYAELVTATGYLAVARRFGFDVLKDQYLTIDDTIDTFSKSVLGLTVACARCHDHKYDPVSANDYYALFGIFESTRYPSPGCEKDRVPRDNVPLVSAAERGRRLEPLKARVDAAGVALVLAEVRGAGVVDAVRELNRANDALNAFNAAVPQGYAVAEGSPHDANLRVKGDPDLRRGRSCRGGFIEVLGGQALPTGARGAAGASWRGGSATRRTHAHAPGDRQPGLAGTFRRRARPDPGQLRRARRAADASGIARMADGGGSWPTAGRSRHCHRRIMLTHAYRRSDGGTERNESIDHDNLTLWRFDRRRLTAEEIRDAMLSVSGDLDPTPGGPHPFPDSKTWSFTQHNPFTAVYDHDRRSVYLMAQWIKRHPFLALFDGPDPNACTGRRDSTTVPTQALFYLNDPFVHARAASLARRLATLPDDSARLDRACRLLFGRPTNETETAVAGRFLAARPGDWAGFLRVMFASNEFVYLD